MAINSATKRKSIAAIGLLAIGPVIVPTGSFDQADRQVISGSYSGILAGAAVTPTNVDANADQVIQFRYRSKVIQFPERLKAIKFTR